MFRSEHSLEITYRVKHLSFGLVQTHKESYVCEFRSGMLGTQIQCDREFLYAFCLR